MSNPESALLLRELYYENYTSGKDKDQEIVFGDVLFREEEDITEHNHMYDMVSDFIRYDLNKFFHISLNEYIHSTQFYKINLIEAALVKIEEINRINNKENNDIENIKNDFDLLGD